MAGDHRLQSLTDVGDELLLLLRKRNCIGVIDLHHSSADAMSKR